MFYIEDTFQWEWKNRYWFANSIPSSAYIGPLLQNEWKISKLNPINLSHADLVCRIGLMIPTSVWWSKTSRTKYACFSSIEIWQQTPDTEHLFCHSCFQLMFLDSTDFNIDLFSSADKFTYTCIYMMAFAVKIKGIFAK